jgi:hypothetical protein
LTRRFGETACQTPEQFKACSQNLGHESVLTTFLSYGAVGNRRQGEIMRNLGEPQQSDPPIAEEIASTVVRKMRGSEQTE